MKRVLIAYSSEDRDVMEQLASQIRDLEREECCDIWEDSHIPVGKDWIQGFRHSIEKAEVAVLIMSSSFLKSVFMREQEVARILERREKEGLAVLSFYVKLCLWERVAWLNSIPVFPLGRKALVEMDEPIQLQILEIFAKYIFDILDTTD